MKSKVSIPSITDIEYDVTGNLWISTYNGVFKFDGYTIKKYYEDENKPIGLIKNKIHDIHKAENGDIWFAGEYSIYRYSPKYDDFERMTENFRSSVKSIYNIIYFAIEDVDEEHKIFGTKNGAWIYHVPSKSMVRRVDLVDSLIVDGYSTNAHVFKIIRDARNDRLLWLFTKSGLVKFDKSTYQSEYIPFPSSIGINRFGDRGHSIIDTKEKLYLLHNFLAIYEFDKQEKKWRSIPVYEQDGKGAHIRNLLPFKDGFLIVYINYDVEYFNAVTGERTFLRDKYLTPGKAHEHSHMTYDHTGRLTFIRNNQSICKSTQSFNSTSTEQQIFTKNLFIEGISRPDSIPFDEPIFLSEYQRNIRFEVGLTNRLNTDEESFYYTTNNKNDWKRITNYSVNLQDLSYGSQTVKVKAVSKDKTLITTVKKFYIKPFFYETWWFLTLISLSLLGVGSVIFYLLNIRKKEKLRFEQQLLTLEMNTLRSQMNPHFLFNSLNSIKNYVVSKSRDEAADYLTDFSRLIRMILENSRKKVLTLEEEVKMLELYIEMERRRLNNSFTYLIEVHPEVDQQFIVPPLLFQPYIENALWHGLMGKYGDKHLSVRIEPSKNGIICRIIDNGIGRKASLNQKSINQDSKTSLAMKIADDRFKIFNQMYNIHTSCEIIDLYDDERKAIGTEVIISLPRVGEQFGESIYS